MIYTIAVCTVKIPGDRQRNCPKHVVFYSKNKFEKLLHLVGFIIRIYYNKMWSAWNWTRMLSGCVFLRYRCWKNVLLCFHITLVCWFQLLYYLASLSVTTTNHIHMTQLSGVVHLLPELCLLYSKTSSYIYTTCQISRRYRWPRNLYTTSKISGGVNSLFYFARDDVRLYNTCLYKNVHILTFWRRNYFFKF